MINQMTYCGHYYCDMICDQYDHDLDIIDNKQWRNEYDNEERADIEDSRRSEEMKDDEGWRMCQCWWQGYDMRRNICSSDHEEVMMTKKTNMPFFYLTDIPYSYKLLFWYHDMACRWHGVTWWRWQYGCDVYGECKRMSLLLTEMIMKQWRKRY